MVEPVKEFQNAVYGVYFRYTDTYWMSVDKVDLEIWYEDSAISYSGILVQEKRFTIRNISNQRIPVKFNTMIFKET